MTSPADAPFTAEETVDVTEIRAGDHVLAHTGPANDGRFVPVLGVETTAGEVRLTVVYPVKFVTGGPAGTLATRLVSHGVNSRRGPRAVECPAVTCSASPGEPCQTSTGATRHLDHGLRWLNLHRGPLVRCADGPCRDCWWTGWTPAEAADPEAGD